MNCSYKDLAIKYNTTPEKIKEILDKNLLDGDSNFENLNQNEKTYDNTNIILPYYGKIIEKNCKCLVFNHGLYTQCNEQLVNGEYCKKCKNKKYGTIFERQRFEIGKYLTPQGKKEINYNDFIIKMQYNIDDVINIFKKLNIDMSLIKIEKNIEKRKRGRPKKIENNSNNENNNETIEVERICIQNKFYLRTKENVILDESNYSIIGILENKEIKMY